MVVKKIGAFNRRTTKDDMKSRFDSVGVYKEGSERRTLVVGGAGAVSVDRPVTVVTGSTVNTSV